MNPSDFQEDSLNVRCCTNIPSHGTLPKWLGDMTRNVTTSMENDKNKLRRFADSLEALSYQAQIPEVINKNTGVIATQKNRDSPIKYGRRSSLASQLYAARTPKNIHVTKSNYLIPNYKDFDFGVFEKEARLEKSWEGLSTFRQSHRGRLDSANTGVVDVDLPRMFVWKSETFPSQSYNPSILESNPPTRSKSEMSHHAFKESTEIQSESALLPRDLPIQKSRSSENVFHGQNEDTIRNAKDDLDSLIAKRRNDYKLRVAKEDKLRKEIISELLSDNQIMSEKIKLQQMDSDDDISLQGTLYNKTSKYKSANRKNDWSSSLIDDELFVIPELPSGNILLLHILSTWGDKFYVGLNGIEIFGNDGKLVKVKKIHGEPSDVNVLPECNNDPRVITNLLDGVNRTQDDVHLWLAPFEKGKRHIVSLEFETDTTIAMIRIWNYNKSRIHSYRGVKDLVMYLDDRMIFKGEIAKACGGILGGVDAFGDTILFTIQDSILELISQNDNSYLNLTSISEPETKTLDERPSTSAFSTTSEDRPFTGAKSFRLNEPKLFGAERIDLVLLSNWGYSNMIGFTGFEVVLENEQVLPLTEEQLSCNVFSDIFSLGRLVNGKNLTNNPNNMWCTVYDYTQEIVISIFPQQFVYISGIRIWNYNESLETTYAGVSRMRILLDNKALINIHSGDDVFVLRRSPGNLNYDFVQDIRLSFEESLQKFALEPTFRIEHNHKEEFYENPTMPEGFVVQFIVFSTWDDQYYCGLDGLELFDRFGRKIILDECNICAYPESINVLPGVSGDIRTPDKLIDGVHDDSKGAHSWLAPIIPKCLNKIYVVFDCPITISVIKLWNYSKTPGRGIKEFGILVDDLLVYNGILEKYQRKRGKNQYRTVVFTDDANVIEQELETLIRHSSYGHEVLLLNENLRTTTGGSLPEADPALRPFTSVSPFTMVHTSHSH